MVKLVLELGFVSAPLSQGTMLTQSIRRRVPAINKTALNQILLKICGKSW